jgi:hypothetical protein
VSGSCGDGLARPVWSAGDDGGGDAAAVDVDHGAVDERRLVAGEIDGRVGDRVGRAAAAGRRVLRWWLKEPGDEEHGKKIVERFDVFYLDI